MYTEGRYGVYIQTYRHTERHGCVHRREVWCIHSNIQTHRETWMCGIEELYGADIQTYKHTDLCVWQRREIRYM